MPCTPIDFKDGVRGIVCTTRPRRSRCAVPGCRDWCEVLCDWKLHKLVDGKREYTGDTCDRKLCLRHRHQVARGLRGETESKDLCPEHHAAAKAQGLI
jgi:hypothetical protein